MPVIIYDYCIIDHLYSTAIPNGVSVLVFKISPSFDVDSISSHLILFPIPIVDLLIRFHNSSVVRILAHSQASRVSR